MFESSTFPVSMVDQIEQGARARRIGVLFKTPSIEKVCLKAYLLDLMRMESDSDFNDLEYPMSIALVRNKKNQSLVDFYAMHNKSAHKILLEHLYNQLSNQDFIVDERFNVCDNIIVNYLFRRWQALSSDEFFDLISLVQNVDCLTEIENSEGKSLRSLLESTQISGNHHLGLTDSRLRHKKVLEEFLSASNILDFPACASNNDMFIMAELFLDHETKSSRWLKEKLQALDDMECIFLVRNRQGQNLVSFYQGYNAAFSRRLEKVIENNLTVKKSGKTSPRKLLSSASKLMPNFHRGSRVKSETKQRRTPSSSSSSNLMLFDRSSDQGSRVCSLQGVANTTEERSVRYGITAH